MDGFKVKPKSLTFYVFDRREEKGQQVEIHFPDLTVYCVTLKDVKFSFPGLEVGAGGASWAQLGVSKCKKRCGSVVGGSVEVF